MSVRGRTCMLRPINDELVAHLNIVVRGDANREVVGIIAIEDLEAIIRCLRALVEEQWSFCPRFGPFFIVTVQNRK